MYAYLRGVWREKGKGDEERVGVLVAGASGRDGVRKRSLISARSSLPRAPSSTLSEVNIDPSIDFGVLIALREERGEGTRDTLSVIVPLRISGKCAGTRRFFFFVEKIITLCNKGCSRRVDTHI